jgi:hypothetical protein
VGGCWLQKQKLSSGIFQGRPPLAVNEKSSASRFPLPKKDVCHSSKWFDIGGLVWEGIEYAVGVADEPFEHLVEGIKPFTPAVYLPVRPWSPRSRGFPREYDAADTADPRCRAVTSAVAPRKRHSLPSAAATGTS